MPHGLDPGVVGRRDRVTWGVEHIRLGGADESHRSFEYDPRLVAQPTLTIREGGRLDKLKEKIVEDGAGR
jgi:hypothetical protein